MKLGSGFTFYAKAFWLDRNGDVAALFGVAAVALFLMIGSAVGFTTSPSGQVDVSQDETAVSSGQSAGSNIEVSLMLDVTGSMEGEKLSNLKEAAKDLVNIVVWDDQSAFKSRVALVPFSESVRLPDSAQKSAVGPMADVFSKPASFTKEVTQWHWYYGWQTVNQTYYKTNCLVERSGAQAFTDATPGLGAHVTSFARPEAKVNCGQTSANIITPLTSNKASLETAINKLTASSERAAGHVGTAWAWYTLSPNWNSLWTSAVNQASAYDTAETKKVAILMTDGAFDMQYSSDGLQSSVSDADNGSSTDQARTLCTAMKASGIIVYTVGFELASESKATNTMSHCASDERKVFTAEDGEDLKQVFRAIALEITKRDLSS